MHAVGIDVSKGISTVSVFNERKDMIVRPFDVLHTIPGLTALSELISALPEETKVVMECTGRYHEPVARYLQQAGHFVCTLNPLALKNYGTGVGVHEIKTDKADSKKAAQFGIDNWYKLREYIPMDTTRYQLKVMNQQFDLYTRQQTAQKNNVIGLLDMTFPGVERLFDSPARDDGSQKWVDFAETFWHVDCVRSLSEKKFTERYMTFCKHHHYNFSAAKASAIYDFSKDLFPLTPKDKFSKFMMKEAISHLRATTKVVETLRSEMNRLASQLPEYPVVMEMRGVGASLGPQIIAEIGDPRRFAKKKSLIAFAGIDPGKNQSSSKDSKSVRTSKKGNPLLRKALFNVMTALLLHPSDDATTQFLYKKRAEGKKYYVYMTAGANKFLRVYYGRVSEYLNEHNVPLPSDAPIDNEAYAIPEVD